MAGRVRTIEKDTYGGWIARCPKTGLEIWPGMLWNTRRGAQCVVIEEGLFGCFCTKANAQSQGSQGVLVSGLELGVGDE